MTSSSSFSPTLRALCAEATKGPWHRDGFSMSSIIRKVSDKGSAGEWERVAECFGNWQHDTPLIVFLANRAEAIAELAEAAEKMLGMYVAMINSGDCGSWNPEDDAEVKALRAALARLEEGA